MIGVSVRLCRTHEGWGVVIMMEWKQCWTGGFSVVFLMVVSKEASWTVWGSLFQRAERRVQAGLVVEGPDYGRLCMSWEGVWSGCSGGCGASGVYGGRECPGVSHLLFFSPPWQIAVHPESGSVSGFFLSKGSFSCHSHLGACSWWSTMTEYWFWPALCEKCHDITSVVIWCYINEIDTTWDLRFSLVCICNFS